MLHLTSLGSGISQTGVAFGTAAVAITGGVLAVTAVLLPLHLPSLRRIEISTSKAD